MIIHHLVVSGLPSGRETLDVYCWNIQTEWRIRMSIAENMILEFTQESGTTRKLLERVPDDLAWKPHEKSMSLGRLATHVAEIPHWVDTIVKNDRFDMVPSNYRPASLGSRAEILAAFEQNLAVFTEVLRGQTDENLMRPWAFLNNGQPVFELPKVVALRSFVISHLIHHRGQLSVYLRLKNVPLPGIYGPSADES
jgi:uncharacterized damage-inducible protein DinB